MDQKTVTKYVRSGGVVCPYCGEADTGEGIDGVTIDDGGAYQDIHCLSCDAKWEDFYRLAGIFDLASNELIESEPKTHYYVIVVWDDVEPERHGPYKTEAERDEEAKKLKELAGDESGVYSMDIPIDSDGNPGDVVVRSYSAAFFSGSEESED